MRCPNSIYASCVVSASSDITRFRFDAIGHVNAVTGNSVVFSHNQGASAKNASSIMEQVLIHHLLTSKGEAIKVIIFDNASVGKIGCVLWRCHSIWLTKAFVR